MDAAKVKYAAEKTVTRQESGDTAQRDWTIDWGGVDWVRRVLCLCLGGR